MKDHTDNICCECGKKGGYRNTMIQIGDGKMVHCFCTEHNMNQVKCKREKIKGAGK